jgi:peptidoglycan/LPS O-acetylase OafA/YrhL
MSFSRTCRSKPDRIAAGCGWTIGTELYGSFLVYGLIAAFGRQRWRWLGYGAVAALFYGQFYLAFLVGMAVDRISLAVPVDRPRLAVGLASVGVWLGSYPPDRAWEGIWALPYLPGGYHHQSLAHILGAAGLILAVILSPAKDTLELPIFQFLGRISYGFYLTHFLIMSSLSCWIVLMLNPWMGYLPSIGAGFVVTIPVTLALSYLFTVAIDEPATRFADRFSRRLVGVFVQTYRSRVPGTTRGSTASTP